MDSQANFTKSQRRANTYPSSAIPIYLRRGKNPKLILQSRHYANSKNRQRHYKERKLQANIPDEHRCQNPKH